MNVGERVWSILLRSSGGFAFCILGLEFFADRYPQISLWSFLLYGSGVLVFAALAMRPFERTTFSELRKVYFSIASTAAAVSHQSRAFGRLSWLLMLASTIWVLAWVIVAFLHRGEVWPANVSARASGMFYGLVSCTLFGLLLLVWSFVLGAIAQGMSKRNAAP